MKITILGASGSVGHELTRQALERGHTVTAIARNPAKIDVPDSDRLVRVAADVHNTQAIAQALAGSATVLSGLGVAEGEKSGALTAGARAVVAARPARIIWLGAIGTGESAAGAGLFTRTLLRIGLRAELEDKVTADMLILNAGGTVFHSGPMSSGPLSPTRRTVTLDKAPRRFFPAFVSRATVAAAMLDEAERPQPSGSILIPLER